MATWHVATRFAGSAIGSAADTRVEAEIVDYSDSDFVSFYAKNQKLVLVIPTNALLYAKRLPTD